MTMLFGYSIIKTYRQASALVVGKGLILKRESHCLCETIVIAKITRAVAYVASGTQKLFAGVKLKAGSWQAKIGLCEGLELSFQWFHAKTQLASW